MTARKRRARPRHETRRKDPATVMAHSAQAIWLAGLGALERARAEGPRMFDALVEQGKGLGGKARQAADHALRNLRDGSAADVEELTRQVRELGETVRRIATPPSRKRRSAAASRGAVKRKAKRTVSRAKHSAAAARR